MEFLAVIIFIVVIVLAIKLVVFLFSNVMTSRILCAISSVVAIICAFSSGGASTIIPTALAGLFLCGPVAFETEWDGSWDITETYDGFNVSPHMVGGFAASAAICFVVACIPMLFDGDILNFLILPIIILIIDIITFIKCFV